MARGVHNATSGYRPGKGKNGGGLPGQPSGRKKVNKKKLALGVAAAGLAVGAAYGAHRTGRKIQGREGARIMRPNAPVAASTVKFAAGAQSPFQRGMSASPQKYVAKVSDMKVALAKMDASREARSYHNFEPTPYFKSAQYSADKRRASQLEAMIQEAGDAKFFTLRKTDVAAGIANSFKSPKPNNLRRS